MFPQREGRISVPPGHSGHASLHKRTDLGPFSSISLPNCSGATYQGCKDVVCRCSHESGGGKLTAPWIDRVWRNVFGSLFRWGFLKQLSSEGKAFKQSNSEGKAEVELLLEKTSFKRRKFRPKGKKDMSPLESHLLMVMLKNSFEEGHDLSTVKLHCKCQNDALTSETSSSSKRGTFPLGVFLQPHPLGISKVAPELTLGKNRQLVHKHSGFARLQGEPLMNVSNHVDLDVHTQISNSTGMHASEDSQGILPVQLRGPPLMALMELLPQINIPQQQPTFPDKEKLNSMQDFFLYAETEGRRVFEELDRDKDGKITSEDLKFAMKRMKLPVSYAAKFMCSTQKHWLSKSFGWSEFSSVMLEKEPVMIGLFNSLSVSKSGTVQRNCVVGLLQRAGLAATEPNVSAMMKLLGTEKDSCIKYGQFRKFMVLLPTEQLMSDPWSVWFKAAVSPSEPSHPALQDPVTLLSRGLVNQFNSVKGNVVGPSLQKVANLPDFVRFKVKNITNDPIFRVGADALGYGGLLLSNAAAEVSEFRRRNVISPICKDHGEPEGSQSFDFDGTKHNLTGQ